MADIGEIRGRLTLEDLTSKSAATATSSIRKFEHESDKLSHHLNTSLSPALDKSGNKFKDHSRTVKSAGDALGSLAVNIAGIAAGYLTISTAIDVFRSSIDAISESETATALLEARIKSTGGVAGKTADEINRFAESLSDLIKRDDEEIALAAAELLKFTDISGDQFERIIKLAADMAGPTGDLVAEVEKLGKAAQEPDEALTLLERSVGRFSDAEEEMIKNLAKSGDEAGAAAAMFDILERRVGGTAEAYGTTLGGVLKGISITWENQLELLQEGLSPALKQIADDFDAYISSAEGQADVIQLGKDLGALVISLSGGVKNLAEGLKEIDLGSIINLITLITDLLGLLQKVGQYAKYINPMYWELKLLEKVLGSSANEANRLSKSLTDLSRKPAINLSGLATLPPGMLGTPKLTSSSGSGRSDHAQINPADINRAKQLAKELANIESQLARDTSQARELSEALASGFDQKQIDGIIRTHELHNSWLQDVEKFGASAADSLKSLRASVYDTGKAADEAKKLWDLVKKVQDTRLEPIEIEFVKAGGFDPVEYLEQLSAVEIANDQAFTQQREAVQAQLQDQADYFRDSLKSPRQELEELQRLIDNLADASIHGGEALLSAAEAEQLSSRASEQYYTQQINAWTGFLSQLGDQLGGFFGYVASLAQSIQGVNSTAQSLGGWTTALGAFGGTVAAFVAIYQYADSVIQKHKSEIYGTRGDIRITNDRATPSYINQEGMALTRQIQEVLKSFEDALRISVKDLTNVEIRVRNNGKEVQAWVKGVWVGTFTDVNQAIREALAVALSDPETSLRGMSDLMNQALDKWTSPDMEGLLDFLGQLRAIGDLSLSPLIISLQQSANEFNDLREALNKLDQSSEAVVNAYEEIEEAQRFLFEQTKAQLLGIDLSAAEALRNLAGFQKGMGDFADSVGVGLQNMIEAAQKKILDLTTKGPQSGGGQGVSGPKGPGGSVNPFTMYMGDVASEVDDEVERLQRSIDEWTKQLGEIPRALTDQEIDLGIFTAMESDLRKSGKHAELIAEMSALRVKQQYEELRLQLIGLGAWERWAGIWQELYDQALVDAGRGGGGGFGRGGGGDRDSVKDFIKDRRFELSLTGLTDYQISLKELDKLYEEQLEKAGKDKQLRQELLALKDRELALLKEEQKQTVLGNFREFLGLVTPFDKVRETAADLIKDIEASPFGDVRKAKMIGRILADVEKQIERMARQSTASLLGEMIGDLERFGVEGALLDEARRASAILEHTLKMEHYRTEIEILRATGKISAETMQILDDALGVLSNIDPTTIGNGGGGAGSGGNDPSNNGGYYDSYGVFHWYILEEQAQNAHEAAERLLDQYRDQANQVDTLSERIDLINTDFEAITDELGSTPEIIALWNQTIQDATEEAYQSLTDLYNSWLTGPQSNMTVQQQFDHVSDQIANSIALLNAGDTSQIDILTGLAQNYEDLLGQMFGTSTAEYDTQFEAFREMIRQVLLNAGVDLPDLSSNQNHDLNNLLNFPGGAPPRPPNSPLLDRLAYSQNYESGSTESGIVEASDRVAEVINLRGVKQESLLRAAVTALDNVRDILNSIDQKQGLSNQNNTFRVGD